MNTKVIAEIGVNHNGNLELAKEMISAAKDCGADMVKFQTFSADRLAASDTPKVDYQLVSTDPGESHREMLKKLELSPEQFKELKAFCDQTGLEFCSTPFSREDAEFICSLGVNTVKVSSPDLIDRFLHEYLAYSGNQVILSTGMSTYQEIDETLSIYRAAGSIGKVTLLLCTSAYPTQPADVHLRSLKSLAEQFGLPVGLSDHTATNHAAFAAVALGASIIEKHFTTDKSLPGPDQAASASPEEFSDLVRGIRIIEECLGQPGKEVLQSEKTNRLISRKSVVAAHDLIKGDILKAEDLTCMRPGTGLSPMKAPVLIGKRLLIDIKKGTQILEENVSKE